jgi:hypothetical protein
VLDTPESDGNEVNLDHPASDSVHEIDTRKSLSKKIALIAGIVALCCSVVATVTFAKSSSSLSGLNDIFNTSSAISGSDGGATADTSWVPAGFTVWSGNPNIAWRWADQSTYTCADYGCVSAEFVSSVGCTSGVYAAINWLDGAVGAGGAVISYANATLPSLQPLQVAKLRFDDIEGNGKSAQMATITCY